MKKQKKFKLIKGSFSPNEAKEVLLNIFSNKLQFHQLKNFSSKERLGKEDKTAVKRIPQLKKNMEQIGKLIEAAKQSNAILEITSEVYITIVASKKIRLNTKKSPK